MSGLRQTFSKRVSQDPGVIVKLNNLTQCLTATKWHSVQNEVIEEFQSKFEMSQSYKWQYKEKFLILKIVE